MDNCHAANETPGAGTAISDVFDPGFQHIT